MHSSSFIVALCLATASLLQIAECSNIVFFFGVSSYSHRIPAWPLVEALADKGHNITFVSPHPPKSPDPIVFDYVPTALKHWFARINGVFNVFEDRKKSSLINRWLRLPAFGVMMCEEVYKDDDFVNWVKSTKVDVVILDALLNDCAYGMAYYWGAKVVLFGATAPFGHFSEVYGLPDETSSIPSMELAFPIDMSFTQRLVNALQPIGWYYYRKWAFFPQLEEITRKKLGIMNIPPFDELECDVCLVFINTHHGEEFTRYLPPNVIPIGGIAYTGKMKSIPKEMERFLDESDGFVYMSFGTYAEFSKFDPLIQQAFIGAMQNLSHIKFLWKVGDHSLLEQFPKRNVFISDWMPQQDILAHPKIRAFITHSGLMSIQEAIYNSVPLISFPIFAEQDANAARIHQRTYGIRLEITTVTQTQIEEAIQNVLTDEKYRRNMKKISTMFTERSQTPLETALWWTEFVIRHSKEDLLALRPLSVGQSWWQRRQLDVWATVFVSITATLYLCLHFMYILARSVYRLMYKKTSTKKLNTQKRKQKGQ